MINQIAVLICGFIIGIIISFLFFKKNNNSNSELFNLLKDFKKSIEEYRFENEIVINNTTKIANALTTNQNLKGQFGENCLELVLKVCHPDKNINYIKQFKTTNNENKDIIPDCLVNLPNNKCILIDCKVNTEKYIEYKESNSIEKKQEFIKDLNTTINNLSNKKYETAKTVQQPDFILMYIPLEPIITLIYTDKDFLSVIKNANEKNIIIVGNSSILTTIRLTELLWAQDTQEKNIENIVLIAQNIYKLIAQHSQELFEMKNIMEENNKRFIKEYEKIANNNKLFNYTQQLIDFGIQIENKKQGRKLSEIKIHSDFLN